MVPVKTNFKFGLREKAPSIMKPMLMDREGKMLSILRQMAFIPKLMTGIEIKPKFSLTFSTPSIPLIFYLPVSHFGTIVFFSLFENGFYIFPLEYTSNVFRSKANT